MKTTPWVFAFALAGVLLVIPDTTHSMDAMLLFLREKVWMTCNYNHQPSQGSPTLARKQMVRHSRFLQRPFGRD